MASNPDEFAPIVLPNLSPRSVDVALRIAGVPTLSELTAYLGALPREALEAAVKAEPAMYAGTTTDANDAASYLRALADSFEELSARLTSVTEVGQ